MVLTPELNLSQQTGLNVKIAYAGSELRELVLPELSAKFELDKRNLSLNTIEQYLNEQSLLSLPDVILIEADNKDQWIGVVRQIKQNPLLLGVIVVVISAFSNKKWKSIAMDLKVHDFYTYPFPLQDLSERLSFLVKFKLIKPKLSFLSQIIDVTYKTPVSKRVFDIVSSGTALIILSPVLLLVALAIRLESKGPVLYKSKRVGTGYKIFNFYKFRTMREGADKEVEHLSTLNQYADETGKSAFFKVKDDPRITRLGQFFRNTSIDELPQLYNVFRGDMSLVGNRPLPLYEAEMLTSNEWTQRFLGPAGLTGLWQISKRGKSDMSEYERKKLDNFYAMHHSFWLDIKIILKTFPALLQKEKV
ncbi:sugar transferase [Paradesertivirga mongoliensis]|uniref:Sugar transferase n=1 Tax=Paradesertivirga mongoliensis TaxID=2100740 RepID=A0ABW4ZMZ3_9SPHI|nr:sugar transferase [Pedobacter mongoliensis]